MEAKSGYGLSLEEELKILRVIRQLNETTPIEFVPTFLGAHAIPEEFRSAPEQYVALVIHEMLPAVAEEQLAESCDIFCERGYFDLADSEKILMAAQEHGLRLRMHVDQLTNSGGAFLAARLQRGDGRSPRANERRGDRCFGRGGRSAGAACLLRFTPSGRRVIRRRAP